MTRAAQKNILQSYDFYFNRKLSIHILESFSINIFFMNKLQILEFK